MLNFQLSFDELDALSAKYKTSDPEYMFSYKAFCANINSAFTAYGIQQAPLTEVAPVTVDSTTLARRKYLELTPEEQQMVNDILVEYKKAVQIKRIHLKPMFQDFDITKNQHVTKHQFLRTLA